MINTLYVTCLFNFFHFFSNKMDGQMLNTEIQGLSFLFGRREYMLSQRILFKDGLPRLTNLVMR